MKLTRESLQNRLVFLGTAGARYVAFGFMRQAGGLYWNFGGYNLHVDPGPGAFVHAHRKGIEPFWTDAVLLTHRHLDHCADVNHILEAMTLGGKRKKGKLLCPSDAVNQDPVVLEYTRQNIEETILIEEKKELMLFENLKLTFPVRHVHGVETYGVIFNWNGKHFGYLTDTKFFPELLEAYSPAKDLLIINTTLYSPNPKIDHLSAKDAKEIIAFVKPTLAVLTHFGKTMLSAKPWEVAASIEKETGVKTLAAYDNMIIDLNILEVVRQRR
ncbi:metallo-beta-lactamase family protein [Thermovibrio ammonificans HB-1]|uniref:Metallo-beta-lactamase family protein n=1 Tax=Thermovibrio ammonificans (strain DSM 15698 / JCM 12110 / HB-1) TaxID=648996 RepID=E8T607_THEA1|nr:MBL fold metallo-hydrolase [Thermovibrio ammonificans]ADU96591.1 metallo-beta-lactamase family protein [Thermovibrio ammonificans HB-1]